jgi:hypothetical protein
VSAAHWAPHREGIALITEAIRSAAVAPSPLNQPAVPELNEQTFSDWKEYLLPAPDELRWEGTPWRASFGTGVQEARRSEKPILLWAMNGHPLACT